MVVPEMIVKIQVQQGTVQIQQDRADGLPRYGGVHVL